ncbi:WD40 repeat domain-containing protein [Leptolyngbya ohadii]|uniref:WD40 repeat domain-containing protein n=1 Tax=Leptolyngbya ohadii TaxID=1962290 RepID=UPI000B59E0BD|nr:hypothetical protein [Leptolyngbya ohadii]
MSLSVRKPFSALCPVLRRRFWFAGGTIALLWLGCLVFSQVMTARIDRPVCLLPAPASIPLGLGNCYHRSQQISSLAITAIVQVPDRAELISSRGSYIERWDLATGKRRASWQTPSRITALAVSPDNRILAVAGRDQRIRLWDLEIGILLGEIGTGRVTSLAFSPSGRILASGSRMLRWADGVTSFPGVQFWDVQNAELVDSLGTDPVNAIAFSTDGEFLAVGYQNTRLWRLRRRQPVRVLNSGSVTALEFSPDGEQLITGSSRVKVWDTATGRLQHTLPIGTSDLVISANRQLLATVDGGTVNLWQFGNRSPERLGTLRGSYYSNVAIALDPATGILSTASSDGIRLWSPFQQTQRHVGVQASR